MAGPGPSLRELWQDEAGSVVARDSPTASKAALERCGEFAEAGADVVFLDAPHGRDELAAVTARSGAPAMANMVETGVTPLLSLGELQVLGFAPGAVA